MFSPLSFTGQIDRILDEEDVDNDGYLSYVEYANSRRTQRLLKQNS